MNMINICAIISDSQFYHSGVYSDSQCSQKDLDHAVLVVGYGTSQGLDYWLVKNRLVVTRLSHEVM